MVDISNIGDYVLEILKENWYWSVKSPKNVGLSCCTDFYSGYQSTFMRFEVKRRKRKG